MSVVRVATRGSLLALAQARQMAVRIEGGLGVSVELLAIRTSGDRLRGPQQPHGGKGLFVKEIEETLLAGEADVAVHSAKDLPARLAKGLAIVAIPERADPRDALVARGEAGSLADLPQGARVGTGSDRRAAQLAHCRSDLEILPLRGNVDTRLRKLDAGDFDAIVLACAGLERLGLAARISERLAPEVMLPSVAQGALALEAREGTDLARALSALDDVRASLAVRAERAFLERIGGDCTVPVAALAGAVDASGGPGDDRLDLRGLVALRDGRHIVRAQAVGTGSEPEALGIEVAERLLEAGGAEVLEQLRAEAPI